MEAAAASLATAVEAFAALTQEVTSLAGDYNTVVSFD